MTTNKILVAGLIGAVVSFLLSGLLYGWLLENFFASNQGTATGVMKTDSEILLFPMILSNLALGMLLAIVYGRWAGISTLVTGAKAGAVLGGLMGVHYNMISLSVYNLMNTTAAVFDVAVAAFIWAVVGAAVGWFLGRGTAK